MKALVFEKCGLENLRIADVMEPLVGPHDVLVKVKMAGVNPIDYFTVAGMRTTKPMPHVPGAEFAGTVERIGEHVSSVQTGDRVTVYSRVFDNSCDMCLSNNEMLCRNGGIIGVITNGGYTEHIAVPERNAFKIPDETSWETAASLPVAALTPYHALNQAGLKPNDNIIIFGASGNTGTFAIQFAKRFGANIMAVSRKTWPKEFGADYVIAIEDAASKVTDITSGKMADVVLNSLGTETWATSLDLLGANGRLVFFGTLTGNKAELPLDKIYNKQIRIIGTTGGTRKELQELINISNSLRQRIWKKYKLEEGAEALKALFSKDRDGRILIEI